MQQERVFLQKMNLTLVYVLKQEWPHNWPEFIAEIVQASTTNEVRVGDKFDPTIDGYNYTQLF